MVNSCRSPLVSTLIRLYEEKHGTRFMRGELRYLAASFFTIHHSLFVYAGRYSTISPGHRTVAHAEKRREPRNAGNQAESIPLAHSLRCALARSLTSPVDQQ